MVREARVIKSNDLSLVTQYLDDSEDFTSENFNFKLSNQHFVRNNFELIS